MRAMTRILYVTPQPPSQGTGGGRHCYANLRALCEYPGATVTYVGPPWEERLPGIDGVTQLMVRRYRLADKVRAGLAGAASSLYGLYREVPPAWLCGFDLAFCEFTKAGPAIHDLSRRVRTVCCVHNVEADYMRQGARGWAWLAALQIRRSEAVALGSSDHVLVMHRHDLARLRELYGCPAADRAHLHPVCAADAGEPAPYCSRQPWLVIPGSLDQRFNEAGILRFLRACWPELRVLGCRLIIAGRSPRPALKREAAAAGATVIENPPSMADIVREARVVLVPDAGGAGMKLRVAEALSLGVPVVGTHAGLLGYDDSAEWGCAVDRIGDMATAARELLRDPARAARCAELARDAWARRYSYPAFRERLHAYVREWTRAARAGARPHAGVTAG